MVHLLTRKHDACFKANMDRFMPQRRLHRDELNRSPFAREDWHYSPQCAVRSDEYAPYRLMTDSRDQGPWAERPKLPGRNTVKRKVDEYLAFAKMSPAVQALVRNLKTRSEYEVLHGGSQTVLNYRGQGIGGINREDSRGYLSQVLAVGTARDRIRALGFQLEKMPSPGEAYKNHKWWEVDLAQGVDAFADGLKEFEGVVDRELTRLGAGR
jgi:hypothetical protein